MAEDRCLAEERALVSGTFSSAKHESSVKILRILKPVTDGAGTRAKDTTNSLLGARPAEMSGAPGEQAGAPLPAK
jgi:hypothetical protein